MRIRIERVGFADFDMDLFHLCKLFYDEADVRFEDRTFEDGEPDLTIRIGLETDDANDRIRVSAEATVSPSTGGQSWDGSYERTLSSRTGDDPRRSLKRALGAGLVKVLEQATGLAQPWGTLTGVRPTKLMHNLLLQYEAEEAQRILQDEYFVTTEKASLLSEVAVRQLKVIPDLYTINEKEVSVYIGIPFCPTKCAYCTFPAYDIRGNNGSVEAFLEGLHYEIRETGRWLKAAGLGITTIYWGGGTPTSIEAEQMDALFETLHASFPGMDRVRELTVEAGRPDTITPEKLQVMRKWNVDRISINPQSFTQQTLDTIGRHHTVEETVEKFLLSRSMGLDNINMDLIIGLPNEGLKELRHTLDETEKLLPESLTVHTLSFKRASKMTKNRDKYEVAERDEIRAMMEEAIEWTAKHGYAPYYLYRQKNILGNLENVGYSLQGKESLYNILMMEERQTVVGLGCGAVSKVVYPDETEGRDSVERFPNPKEPYHYNQAFREYTEKKLDLLQRAYGKESMKL
ncbi:coproporphyrinogen III oxidase [Paenibacillus sp.]|uniref:coproporphyrinogen III oxidase n=1 Tax=Paenibacillus sp. TaxID=58172 RepID=UPI00281149AE|nr:coproporphyrinogen III oxidase [Paenibacillus sp.]